MSSAAAAWGSLWASELASWAVVVMVVAEEVVVAEEAVLAVRCRQTS
jgi:hypothetical protein